ncbi:MAG: hypothetical protein P1Q69_10525 [Candidatus Thorarchaeota archaeon]|nr:hypothetical protein [Candidatus Thorarchaeota archaeon]
MTKNNINNITLVYSGEDTTNTHKFEPAGARDKRVLAANKLRSFTLYVEQTEGFDPDTVEYIFTITKKTVQPVSSE